MFRLLTASAALFLTASASWAASFSGNPVIRGAADPFGQIFGDRLYVYPTTGNGQFRAYSTHDFGQWRDDGLLLDLADVGWAGGSTNAWAPSMLERDGSYYFYYSVGGDTSRIGVAVGNSPTGRLVDSGRPLLSDTTGSPNRQFEAIDPMVFQDPVSGKTYLYAGGSRGSTLRVFELGGDLTSLGREIGVATPPQFTEGAFMHYRDGRYYLSYSHGSYQRDDYSLYYATSDSPTGPWDFHGQILGSNGQDKGPGHHSFFEDPANGESYILYHRWEDRRGGGPYEGARDTAIERFTYDANGLINPIALTNTGVEISAIPEPATASVLLLCGAAAGLVRPRRRG